MLFFQGNSYNGTNFQEIWDSLSPISPYGKRHKKSVKALVNKKVLENEYRLTNELLKMIIDNPKEMLFLSDLLVCSKDVVPLVNKAYKGLVLEEEEFFNLKSWLLLLEDIKHISDKVGIDKLKEFKLEKMNDCLSLISPGNQGPSFYLVDSLSEELARLRMESHNIKTQLFNHLANLKKQIEKKLDVKFNVEDKIKVSKFDVELVDLLREQEDLFYYGESYSHIEFKLKQDSFVIDLKHRADFINSKMEKEEYLVREMLTKQLTPFIPKILQNCKRIGRLDWTLIKAYYAKETQGLPPEINETDLISIKNGRNPILENVLLKKNKVITPLNIEILEGVAVITGPNMGGKSVALKTIGLLVALAQHGLLVPCTYMTFRPRKFLFYSQNDGQSIYNGLSTFGWEIRDIKKALAYRNKKGLYLIDELARGTNPLEGGALALSIANYLNGSNSISVMTTHFEELVNKDFRQLRIVGLSNLSKLELRRALKGRTGLEIVEKLMDYNLEDMNEMGLPKEGVMIAALMGLPKEIIDFAENIIESGRRKEDG
ncbi:hypothetical protein HYG86_10310 [Alkalicella caledoniensis]|uniref:MutS-like protein n=1 Tax=Alkalicella caledoniensis TaxID=2731377 RepID=A0A7G9W8W3_ALKCA|nr:hypothetical protein [Alkalicella caledoniensis]QNO15125.1 hypothetical protein HYG86_10310 [Alkalicella caledoniensis]